MVLHKKALMCFLLMLNFSAFAQEQTQATDSADKTAYISDELFIYMHTGPGKNYRIIGSITAGSEIILTGKKQAGYTQLVDNKDRTAWVEDKYINEQAGLRNIVAELNSKLASYADQESKQAATLSEQQLQIEKLATENNVLTKKLAKSEQELASTKQKLKDQDTEILTQWFFNGAIVLGIGLILGIILPHLSARKRKTTSWS